MTYLDRLKALNAPTDRQALFDRVLVNHPTAYAPPPIPQINAPVVAPEPEAPAPLINAPEQVGTIPAGGRVNAPGGGGGGGFGIDGVPEGASVSAGTDPGAAVDAAVGLSGLSGLTSGVGELDNAQVGALAGIPGAIAGVPGLGLAGAAIGTARDMHNAKAATSLGNLADDVSSISHFGHAISGGLLGQHARDQAVEAAQTKSPNQNPADVAYGMPANAPNRGPSRDGNESSGQAGGSAGHATAGGAMGDGTRGGNDGAGGGERIICGELVRQGLMALADLADELRFTHESLTPEHVAGYLFWARPVVARMKRSKRWTALWLRLARARIADVRWREGDGPFHLGGRLLNGVMEPVCATIGAFLIDENEAAA